MQSEDCNFDIYAGLMVIVVCNEITGITTSVVWLKFYCTNFTDIVISNKYYMTSSLRPSVLMLQLKLLKVTLATFFNYYTKNNIMCILKCLVSGVYIVKFLTRLCFFIEIWL